MAPKQKTLNQMLLQESRFNARFKIGDKVKLRMDNGEIKEVTVRASASILINNSAVGWFEEIKGCYNLDRVIIK